MKILIVQIGKIGDMVLTTPLIRELALHVPDAQLHALVSCRGLPVVLGSPRLNKIILYRKDPVRLLLLFIRLLFSRYDVWIDPKDHFSRESAILALCGRAKKKIGFNRPDHGIFSYSLPSQEENFNLHAASRNLSALKALGGSLGISNGCRDIRPELFPDPLLSAKIRKRLFTADTATVLLNISAGDASRQWETGKWSEVAKYCLHKGLRVILSFKPADESMARAVWNLQPETELFRSSSIREIIALIPCVRFVVTPDTSIVHIASAFNVPQIALFPYPEWNLFKFRPLSDLSIVIQPRQGAALATIETDRVRQAVETILQKIKR